MLAVETLSHPLAVRELLSEMIEGMTAWNIAPAALDRVELVLAEALNNVFEHACGYRDGVRIAARACHRPPLLTFEIVDQGAPMPGLVLPKQALPGAPPPRVDVEKHALPEGGWGWMLIRELADTVAYERRDDGNHLRISLRVA